MLRTVDGVGEDGQRSVRGERHLGARGVAGVHLLSADAEELRHLLLGHVSELVDTLLPVRDECRMSARQKRKPNAPRVALGVVLDDLLDALVEQVLVQSVLLGSLVRLAEVDEVLLEGVAVRLCNARNQQASELWQWEAHARTSQTGAARSQRRQRQ